MTAEARGALARLVAAFEHHLDLTLNADIVSDAVLDTAEERLRDAFFTYDDVLFTESGIDLPFELLDDEGEDEDEDDQIEEVDLDNPDYDSNY